MSPARSANLLFRWLIGLLVDDSVRVSIVLGKNAGY
jgi:hypothetical protein